MVRFRRLRGGKDPITDGQWNLLVETVEKLANLRVAPPLEFVNTHNAAMLTLGKIPIEGTMTTPDVITPVPESTETADTDTFDREIPAAGTDGVSVKILTRVVYNDAGDEILYGFYRTFTFDSRGLLRTISIETRYTVETPGACP